MYKDNYPSKLLEDAVESISSLPGVGRRSALRLALYLLKQPSENVHHFTSSINQLRDNVCYCSECGMISDSRTCSICADSKRDKHTICVVESVRDVMSIEKTNQYKGVYHVLGGVISPINGVGISDLRISELINRVAVLVPESKSNTQGCETHSIEVIFALSGDVEGETTSFYLYRQLSPYGIRISSLARGLGFGDDLEYADELTLGRSIANRQEFHP